MQALKQRFFPSDVPHSPLRNLGRTREKKRTLVFTDF